MQRNLDSVARFRYVIKINGFSNYYFCEIFLCLQVSPTKNTSKELLFLDPFGKWQRRDVQQCNFKNYDLIYAFYCKFPSWGCPAKLRDIAANKPFFLSLFLTSNPTSSFDPVPFPLNFLLSPFKSPATTIPSLPNKYLLSSDPRLLFKQLIYLQSFLESNVLLNNFDEAQKSILSKAFLSNLFVYCDILVMIVKVYSKYKFNMRNHDCHLGSKQSRPQFGPFSFFYIYFTLFAPVFTFTDFESPLVLFSWWRNKISWELLKKLLK